MQFIPFLSEVIDALRKHEYIVSFLFHLNLLRDFKKSLRGLRGVVNFQPSAIFKGLFLCRSSCDYT